MVNLFQLASNQMAEEFGKGGLLVASDSHEGGPHPNRNLKLKRLAGWHPS